MTTKQPDFAELNALAIQACDMWQDHLSTFAKDPNARAELTRFLEPQRRLFADWAAMMQPGSHTGGGSHDPSQRSPETKPAQPEPAASAPEAEPAPRGAEHGDDPLRVAQLAHRVAELEKRLARLEERTSGAPRRTQRPAS